jgi:hypothetical protein
VHPESAALIEKYVKPALDEVQQAGVKPPGLGGGNNG